MLAGLIRGPGYSPILHPQSARCDRRNLVLELMERDGKITRGRNAKRKRSRWC